MKLALASLAAIAVVAPAFAEGNIELSGAYSNIDTDPADLGALTARGTYFFNPHFGVEGEASFGVKDDDFGATKVELDNSVAAFGVAQMPVSERVDLFARAGVAQTKYKASSPAYGYSDTNEGLAYGAGAKVFLTDRFGLRGDFTRYEGDNSNDADVISIGGVMKF